VNLTFSSFFTDSANYPSCSQLPGRLTGIFDEDFSRVFALLFFFEDIVRMLQ